MAQAEAQMYAQPTSWDPNAQYPAGQWPANYQGADYSGYYNQQYQQYNYDYSAYPAAHYGEAYPQYGTYQPPAAVSTQAAEAPPPLPTDDASVAPPLPSQDATSPTPPPPADQATPTAQQATSSAAVPPTTTTTTAPAPATVPASAASAAPVADPSYAGTQAYTDPAAYQNPYYGYTEAQRQQAWAEYYQQQQQQQAAAAPLPTSQAQYNPYPQHAYPYPAYQQPAPQHSAPATAATPAGQQPGANASCPQATSHWNIAAPAAAQQPSHYPYPNPHSAYTPQAPAQAAPYQPYPGPSAAPQSAMPTPSTSSAPPTSAPPTSTLHTARPPVASTGLNRAIKINMNVPNVPKKPAAPVYTKAAPVQTASKTPATVAGTPDTSSPSASSWPPSLKSYVMRAFKVCKGVGDRAVMDSKLKDLIMTSTKNGLLWSTDWDTFPLPKLTPSVSTPAASPAAQANDAWLASRRPAAPSSATARWGGSSQGQNSYDRDAYDRDAYERNERASYQSSNERASHQSSRDYSDSRQDWNQDERRYGRPTGKREHASTSSSSSDDEGTTVQYGFGQPGREQQRAGAEAAKRQRRMGRFGAADDSNITFTKGAKGGKKGGRKMRVQVQPAYEEYAAYQEYQEPVDLAPVVGSCQTLEKSYFRLTCAPDPASVRPPVVLERALQRLVGMLLRGEATYFYACDQFKGMRQDITVQHIRSSLTVRVYEAHGRAALEYGEIADFNQCQTQLYMLYADGLQGSVEEFLAYRVLYQTVHAAKGEQRSLLGTMQGLSAEQMALPAVAHALRVRHAVFTGDYSAFFQLYASAPGLGRALMDVVLVSVRHSALVAICKSFRPSVPVEAMASLLGFVARVEGGKAARGCVPKPGCKEVVWEGRGAAYGSEAEAMEACKEWMMSHGALVMETAGECVLDSKSSSGKLVIPEDTSKVAHGDANLTLEDFFAKIKP